VRRALIRSKQRHDKRDGMERDKLITKIISGKEMWRKIHPEQQH
jgi:hypothetical protein